MFVQQMIKLTTEILEMRDEEDPHSDEEDEADNDLDDLDNELGIKGKDIVLGKFSNKDLEKDGESVID